MKLNSNLELGDRLALTLLSNKTTLADNSSCMWLAERIAKFGMSNKAKVGSIIVDSTRGEILAYGCNNAATRAYKDIIHAEMHAIFMAAKYGIPLINSVLFVTRIPCWSCFKGIYNSGIREIYFRVEEKPHPQLYQAAKQLRVIFEKI